MPTPVDAEELRARLEALCREHKVPGAAIGILHDGDVTEAATGVVNLETGVEVTTDTVFQIGSMGKAWTATAFMALVDEGLVSLDEPVRTYLPDFRVADPDVSAAVTPRHLLTHTSGIDGDHFEDQGRGDDCLERYVTSCARLEQTHPFGATMSYCNTGYSILGRIIEVVTDRVWDTAMRERLFSPLGLTRTCTLPEEALLHRTAVGHVPPQPGAAPERASVWMLPRVCGPMGLINSTVRDVLAFAGMHLDGGRTSDGSQVLSEEGARAMQEPQVEVPDPHSLGSHWGLGWILFDWGGHRLYGHDGNTIGQSSFLRIAPDANLAITMLTNGGGAAQVYRALFGELFGDLAGIDVPPLPEAPSAPLEIDLSPYAGTYERLAVRVDLAAEDGRLAGTTTLSGPLASVLPNPVQEITLTPVDDTTFLALSEGAETPSPAVFYDFEGDAPRYLHMGARAHPRIDD